MRPLSNHLPALREYAHAEAIWWDKNNISPWDNPAVGVDGEERGCLGELGCNEHFGLPLTLHRGFDHGYDLDVNGILINAKATPWMPKMGHLHLQWPVETPIRCDVAMLVAVDLTTYYYQLLGYATAKMLKDARINDRLPETAREIPIPKLLTIREFHANYLSNRYLENNGSLSPALYASVDAGRFVVGTGSHGRHVYTLPR